MFSYLPKIRQPRPQHWSSPHAATPATSLYVTSCPRLRPVLPQQPALPVQLVGRHPLSRLRVPAPASSLAKTLARSMNSRAKGHPKAQGERECRRRKKQMMMMMMSSPVMLRLAMMHAFVVATDNVSADPGCFDTWMSCLSKTGTVTWRAAQAWLCCLCVCPPMSVGLPSI